MKYRCRVIESIVVSEFCKANDRRDGIAHKWCEGVVQLASIGPECKLQGILAVVCETAKNCFRATQYRYPFRFAPKNLFSYELNCFRRTCRKQWCLVCGDLHRSRIA